MCPGMDEDASASLGAVCDSQPINAGRVALEIAGEGVCLIPATGAAVVDRQQRRTSWKCSLRSAPEDVGGVSRNVHTFRQDRDTGAFVGSHNRRFLQLLRQVPVYGRIPSENALEGNAIHRHRWVVGTTGEVIPHVAVWSCAAHL